MLEYKEIGALLELYKDYLQESKDEDEAGTQFLWLRRNELLDEEKVKEYNAKNFLQGTR